MTIEEIVQQYPSLRPGDVHDALAYAYDHPDEMAADLAADDEAACSGNGLVASGRDGHSIPDR